MKYLRKFNNHSDYEQDRQILDLPNVSYCVQENEVHYNPYIHDYSQDYLTFEALGQCSFGFEPKQDRPTEYDKVKYSLDNGLTWRTLDFDGSIYVSAGSKILWKGNISPNYYYNKGVGTFSSTGQFNVEGNPLSILKGDNFKDSTAEIGAFEVLFKNCTKLISAENLSIKTVTNWSCWHMFEGCTSLTTAPELPATILRYECYHGMFSGCSSLNYIKCLATNISDTNCTKDWVNGVASSGTFVKAESMTSWTSGVNGIPSGWTVEDA